MTIAAAIPRNNTLTVSQDAGLGNRHFLSELQPEELFDAHEAR